MELSTDGGPKDARYQPLIRENAPHGMTFFRDRRPDRGLAAAAAYSATPCGQKSDPPEGGYSFGGVSVAQAAAPPRGKRAIKTLRRSTTAPCARQGDCSSVTNLPDFAGACALCLLSTRRHDPDPWRTSRIAAMPINAQSRHAICPRGACPRAIRMTT